MFFERDRRRKAEGRAACRRLLEKFEHVVAVGRIVAAHEIEQAAFAVAQAMDGGSLFAKPEQSGGQVTRPSFRRAELLQELMVRQIEVRLSRRAEGNGICSRDLEHGLPQQHSWAPYRRLKKTRPIVQIAPAIDQ